VGDRGGEGAADMPRNAATQRRYSGINVLILWGAVIERGFSGASAKTVGAHYVQ
jgi:antirestriction protein ArdC